MKTYTYHEAVGVLVHHGLIHLYQQIQDASGHVPRSRRNEILVKWLKSKVADRSLRPIKSDLRRLIAVGRSKEGNLEAKLKELNTLHVERPARTCAEDFYVLLTTLKDSLGVSNAIINGRPLELEPNVLYLEQDELEGALTEAGEMIRPVHLFMHASSKVKAICKRMNSLVGYEAHAHEAQTGVVTVSFHKVDR